MRRRSTKRVLLGIVGVALVASAGAAVVAHNGDDFNDFRRPRAKNVILFIGDGMGVSTVTATRVYSVGVAGQLVMDQFPYTALSRTYSADSITPDSAPTMTAMMTGSNANAGVLGLDDKTEFSDFNGDGDGKKLRTLLEQAKQHDMKVGVVSTARITHATPAATYSHINNRDNENAISLQSLPTDGTYNPALGDGVDVLFGGGRRHFVPSTVTDEEGSKGSRTDGRDLRTEYKNAGYTYVYNTTGFNSLDRQSLPVLGLFEASHMEWEFDRASDAGGEPSLTAMTLKAIDLLKGGQRRHGWNRSNGYFLMVEGGRIDHAHHDGNALRALHDAQELDEAIGAAIRAVDLRDTLIIVSADHSHVFNIAGYPVRPRSEMPYPIEPCPGSNYGALLGNGVLDLVYDVNIANRCVAPSLDNNGTPYTALVYGNGPGYRGVVPRVNPTTDTFVGLAGSTDFAGPDPTGFPSPNYRQESTVPFVSETHSAEEVSIYAIGPGSDLVRGTVKNTFIYRVMAKALGF